MAAPVQHFDPPLHGYPVYDEYQLGWDHQNEFRTAYGAAARALISVPEVVGSIPDRDLTLMILFFSGISGEHLTLRYNLIPSRFRPTVEALEQRRLGVPFPEVADMLEWSILFKMDSLDFGELYVTVDRSNVEQLAVNAQRYCSMNWKRSFPRPSWLDFLQRTAVKITNEADDEWNKIDMEENVYKWLTLNMRRPDTRIGAQDAIRP